MLRLSFDSAEHRIDAWKDPIHRARRAIRVMGFVRHVGEGTPNSVEKLGGRGVLWQATRRFDFERDGSGAEECKCCSTAFRTSRARSIAPR
jgi:hypothetical protein